ncbi:hypothetical protein [uncultured Stenotrophomonas sp.]|uniref:hypothetical protein n=1 Tax=uncultured Stenotrophomonas sp. TaxID=165438 RepID=UPI0025E4C340|nr:hypothetical protein [uncultured Stenotrophomonas sp.]
MDDSNPFLLPQHSLRYRVQRFIAKGRLPRLYPWLIILAAIALGAAYLIRFHSHPLGDPDSWGQFGDFLGGLLNPLVGIVTVLMVLETLRITRREAADTRAALEHQRLEMHEQTRHASDQAESAAGQLQAVQTQLAEARAREALAYLEKHLDALVLELDRSMQTSIARQLQYRKDASASTYFNSMTRKAEVLSKLDRAAVAGARGTTSNSANLTTDRADQSEKFNIELEKWRSEFGHAIELVTDIATYCDLYAVGAGASAISLYHYRHRAHPVADALQVLGLIDESTGKSLAPGPVPKPAQPDSTSSREGAATNDTSEAQGVTR